MTIDNASDTPSRSNGASPRRRRWGGARAGLALGLLGTTAAIVFVLSRSPPLVAATNAVPFGHRLAATSESAGACQAGETLPAGTSAIRLSLEASQGPRLTVEVLSRGRIVTRGERGAGWGTGVVTVKVKPLRGPVPDAKVCFAFRGAHERVSIFGTAMGEPATSSQGALPGRMRIEYLRPGRASWWSLASSVARRMGLGRAWAGTWVVLLVLALMTAAVTLASWLTVRDLR